jgi:phospholipid-transporting ATPase
MGEWCLRLVRYQRQWGMGWTERDVGPFDDRETNLKIKQANSNTAHLTSPHVLCKLSGSLLSEAPNSSLYTYDGTLRFTEPDGQREKTVPIGPDQMLLRGAQIRNTEWAFGLVVAAGHETKLFKNAT